MKLISTNSFHLFGAKLIQYQKLCKREWDSTKNNVFPIYEAQTWDCKAVNIWFVDSVSFRRMGSTYCTWALPLMLGGYSMTNKSLASMHAYTQTCLQVSLLTQINGQIQTENGSVTTFMWYLAI